MAHVLTKPVDEVTLLRATAEALEVDRRRRFQQQRSGELLERYATLTARERETMAHVVKGRLNKQIAADLGVVEKTIKVHRARAMTKMAATSLAGLVRLALLVEQELRGRAAHGQQTPPANVQHRVFTGCGRGTGACVPKPQLFRALLRGPRTDAVPESEDTRSSPEREEREPCNVRGAKE